ncbi:MAG: Z1 domain-containing protein [Chloroflexota bacterium]|nr:Z1 domain-containing protein [Chloroflexota bacterium]MDE2886563.1 Z1 domain-containing protein [Chloroflexota bacterium]
MTDPLSNLENVVAAALANQQEPTGEGIRELINGFRHLPMFESVAEEDAELLAKRFEEKVSVTQHLGAVLTERDHQPWLDAARARMEPYYWDRYRRHLIQEGFPNAGVITLDEVTDRVLGLMQDPLRDGPWDRRGMVVGHVQSGKTANYIGLMCKAADAGYKLIVIIAGIHNNLRGQTQQRVDEGFVGRDSARLLSKQDDMFVGVGRFDQTRRPVTFTNTNRDFNKMTATGVGVPLQNLTEPAVFVIKKNSSTLKNLIEWLREHSARGGSQNISEPMLLIDDEADNASINIAHGAGEVSRINGQIRELLHIFDRSCYVGYTATPFANIFIDPDTDDQMRGEDLFPRSFIVSLDPPSNYFGATTVFLDDPDRYIRHIEDNEDVLPIKHSKEIVVTSLPPSLGDAVRAFVLGRAIRLARGHEGEHCSMLVNASRFMNVQRQFRNEIHALLDSIQRSIRVNGALPPDAALSDVEISALHRVWQHEFRDTEFDWSDVQERLHAAAAPIRVVEVNSQSPGTLDYSAHRHDGLNVIAVGGFSLSRGLTLEGLMVSYFLRNSMMYDTLMQMGRWFGYRFHYEDLCRIWMPESAQGWYEHIAESIEELRGEFRSMEASKATPEEFGLKVRSHPDSLIVTACNKMGTGATVVVRVGLAGRLIETHALLRDRVSLEANRQAAQRLSQRLGEAEFPIESAEDAGFGLLLQGAPVDAVLGFLAEFQNHQSALLTDGDPVRQYIEERRADELANWDILFAGVNEKAGRVADDLLGRTIYCQQRTAGDKSDSRTLLIGNRQRVSSRGIEQTGLTLEQKEIAEREHRDNLEKDGRRTEGRIEYPDYIYRKVRPRPLLMVHLIDIVPHSQSDSPDHPVVAWGISFPATQREERKVEYVVNTTWLRENYREDLDEDEMQGDDV